MPKELVGVERALAYSSHRGLEWRMNEQDDLSENVENIGAIKSQQESYETSSSRESSNRDESEVEEKSEEDIASLTKTSEKLELICDKCQYVRATVILCLHCGDRIDQTEDVNPYDRLQLDPLPLYSNHDIQVTKEKLLVIFHPLKASRLNAKWSLKQRALICRDAQILSSISGALFTYIKFLKNQRDLHEGKQWDLKNITEETGRGNIEIHLLDTAYQELNEYDGYQERERLLNRVSRELLQLGISLANQLYPLEPSEEEIDQILIQVERLAHLEIWLDRHRNHI